jgi:localization factor PodJL
VPQDLAEAAKWYQRAAESGLAPAQYRLGSLYEKGQGVARDPKAAATWYTRAAEAGNAKSMHNLAVLHAEGGLGQPDYAVAAKWFEQAADFGVRDSQYNLGILYARGLGVPRDLTASYKWFAIAAQAGDADSAKKRDDVAQVLDKDALARARLAVETWKQKTPDPAANDVVADDPSWNAAPEQTAATVGGGDLVMQAQTLLARRGYDPGPADGKMGKRTRDAIAAFQKARGLPVTGDVDAVLIQALAEQAI